MQAITECAAELSGWILWQREDCFGALLIFPPDPPMGRVNGVRERYAWSLEAECDAQMSLTVPLPRALYATDWADLEAIVEDIEPVRIGYGLLMSFLPVAPGVCLQTGPQGALTSMVERLESAPCIEGAMPRRYPFVARMTIAELISVEQIEQIMIDLRYQAPEGSFQRTGVSYPVPTTVSASVSARLRLRGQKSDRGSVGDRWDA